MAVLYIGPKMSNPRNGGDLIEFRNQKILERICEGLITYFSPDFQYTSFTAKLRMTIGMTKAKKVELKHLLTHEKYTFIFVSQSTYGGYVKFIKKISNTPIITFFHNAEIDYFFSAYSREKRSLKGLHYIAKVIWCEYLSAKKTDFIITLNDRDSKALKKYYGREANLILPTTFEDTYNTTITNSRILDIDYLFVGSNFFANTEGLQWFIDNVFPYINGHLWIIGNGMDTFDFKNTNNRIHILGFVKDISSFYNRAKIVISPIFSGSGMKTKTAEALMFGKTIVGTKEAFEGYIIESSCMILCNTPEDFINSLRRITPSINKVINEKARLHFLEHYSNEKAHKLLKQFLNHFQNVT